MEPQVRAMIFVTEELLRAAGATETLPGSYNAITIPIVPGRVRAQVHLSLDNVTDGLPIEVRAMQGGDTVGTSSVVIAGVSKGRVEQTIRLELEVRNSELVQLVATTGGKMLKASSLSVSVRPRG
ncbi:MAG: hypothetical protein ACYCW6_00465 [Candidatus Xenobia bacterium]